jgi:AcrR family transcriptional regulator
VRNKDQHKQDAIIKATVDLVNEIGFVSSSVSKIAKKANVSPATIYIYYKNKEDLLVSTYIEIKKKKSKAFLVGFDKTKPFRDIFFKIWVNAYEFVKNNKEISRYAEQFGSSPYSDLVDHAELEKHFEPFWEVLQRGIEQKVIKDVPFDILVTFMFFPIMTLTNPKFCKSLILNESVIETSFSLAWDAVKL